MASMKEHYVTLTIMIIAVICIIGGFASFTGLSVENAFLSIENTKEEYLQSDVLDANIKLEPITFSSDETLSIYIDRVPVSVIVLKKYFDENRVRYTEKTEFDNIKTIKTKDTVRINIADYVSLETLSSGTHEIYVELSKGQAVAVNEFLIA